MPYRYTAFGLGISSDVLLPELPNYDGSVDVEIRIGQISDSQRTVANGQPRSYATSREALFFWDGVGTFYVQNGRIITINPASDASEDAIRLQLLGPVLGALLHLRGDLLLHASAVASPDGAIAFLGHSGWGKSTLAAAFYHRGWPVLTDDITVVRTIGNRVMVVPGFPQIKLWPDSATALGYATEELPRLHQAAEKRALRFSTGFRHEPLPLQHLYILAAGRYPVIEPIVPQQALLELVRHSYAASALQSTGASAAHIRQCAEVVNNVPLRRLRKGDSIEYLQDLVRLIKCDQSRYPEMRPIPTPARSRGGLAVAY